MAVTVSLSQHPTSIPITIIIITLNYSRQTIPPLGSGCWVAGWEGVGSQTEVYGKGETIIVL